MLKASGMTNKSVSQSFRKKPSATCSKQSARYIGLRVKRNGPPRTIVNAGLAGATFVPAAFIVTRDHNASVGARMMRAIPQTREMPYLIIGSWIRRKCTRVLITACASQMNGGKAITPGLSDDVFNSAILRRRKLAGDERFCTSNHQVGSILGRWFVLAVVPPWLNAMHGRLRFGGNEKYVCDDFFGRSES